MESCHQRWASILLLCISQVKLEMSLHHSPGLEQGQAALGGYIAHPGFTALLPNTPGSIVHVLKQEPPAQGPALLARKQDMCVHHSAHIRGITKRVADLSWFSCEVMTF